MAEKCQASKEKALIQKYSPFEQEIGRFNEVRPFDEKFQAPKNKSQINPNGQNSKFQTKHR